MYYPNFSDDIRPLLKCIKSILNVIVIYNKSFLIRAKNTFNASFAKEMRHKKVARLALFLAHSTMTLC